MMVSPMISERLRFGEASLAHYTSIFTLHHGPNQGLFQALPALLVVMAHVMVQILSLFVALLALLTVVASSDFASDLLLACGS